MHFVIEVHFFTRNKKLSLSILFRHIRYKNKKSKTFVIYS